MSTVVSHKKTFLKRTAGAVIVFSLLAGTFALGSGGKVVFAQSNDSPVTAAVTADTTILNSDAAAGVNGLIPEVRDLQDKKLQATIDQTVKEKTMNAIVQANVEMKQDKEEWLKAGKTENEMIPQAIFVNYEVKNLTNDLLSFVVRKAQTQANYNEELVFYNYDLKTGKELTVKDALDRTLGKDSFVKAKGKIRAEIEKRSKAADAMFFDGSEGVEGFQGIVDDQKFYINQKGNPVIVFNKYEIAPGYMGIQEFEMTK